MKLQMFAVWDNAVEAYLPPFFLRSHGEALRGFEQASREDKRISSSPKDYVLHYLGEWDDGTGLFVSREPSRLVSAHELAVAVAREGSVM